jgi:asparagine synthase (glutamine-hydrolysing)
MCGIAGIAFFDQRTAPEQAPLTEMIQALRHRGPDGFGYYRGAGIGLAHARLSIIDLVTGDQPISNEDGSLQVVFNGEIFNYLELRADLIRCGHQFRTQSDTEVIVHAYEEYGLDGCLQRLNGQFAIALWDQRARRLILARDRVGIRPIVYTRLADRWLFASEAKSIFAAANSAPRLSARGFAEVAHFWTALAPTTAFEGIAAVPAGHYLVIDGAQSRLTRYWDWNFDESRATAVGQNPEAAIEELRSLLVDSVNLQLRADVPVGTYLSGGLDSSAISAAARRRVGGQLQTFSLSFDDAEFDESAFQRETAAHLGTAHTQLRVGKNGIAAAFARAMRHIEAPIVRTAAVPLMLLADEVRRNGIKVVLTGEGADEVFAGYDIFKEAKIRRFWSRQPQSQWRSRLLQRLYGYLATSPVQSAAMARRFFGRGLDQPDDPWFAHRTRFQTTSRVLQYLTPEFRALLPDEADLLTAAHAPAPNPRWPPLARDQYVEAKSLLSGYLLHAQGDRVAMAASIEARYPFLDHRLIEFAGRMPSTWLLRGLQEKYLLKRAVAAWLPASVTNRTKQPYRAPDSACFFEGGRPVESVAERLSERELRVAGIFDSKAVGKLLQKVAAGQAVGFGDNMAFMLVLSTQQLRHEFGVLAP